MYFCRHFNKSLLKIFAPTLYKYQFSELSAAELLSVLSACLLTTSHSIVSHLASFGHVAMDGGIVAS